MRPAYDVLTVFVGGDEVPGVIAYGLRSAGPDTDPAWEGVGLDLARDPHPFRLHGPAWEVVGWDLALRSWPTSATWPDVVRRLLQTVLDLGCVVAWLGAEGIPLADPPDLFDPVHMTGGALAALTSAGDLVCALDPQTPVRTLTDQELLLLRAHAGELTSDPGASGPGAAGPAMRYPTLSADHLRPQLRDDGDPDATPLDSVSEELRDTVERWNDDDYQVVVPLGASLRRAVADIVAVLDDRGLELARRIAAELHPAEVACFSEGRGRLLA